jgi:ADP-heptose:LPS heptosyltransferase
MASGPGAPMTFAFPPFHRSTGRYAGSYRGVINAIPRPPDASFYRNEQDYYLDFARRLGCEVGPPPHYFLPIAPDTTHDISSATVVLAPGCKTGVMASKRWPYFPQLAGRFAEIVLVGTSDDLTQFDGTRMRFPGHVRSLVGELSLAETASVLAAAGAVVANDSGLGHVAGAVGAPTLLLFGPTPHAALGQLPPNVAVLRAGLACEPCWHGDRFGACAGRIDCLGAIEVERVAKAVKHVS